MGTVKLVEVLCTGDHIRYDDGTLSSQRDGRVVLLLLLLVMQRSFVEGLLSSFHQVTHEQLAGGAADGDEVWVLLVACRGVSVVAPRMVRRLARETHGGITYGRAFIAYQRDG